jgi:hypothetical protein
MIQKFGPLVKRQIEYWQRDIDKYAPDHPRYRAAKIERYRALVADFRQLLEFLNKQEGTDLRPEERQQHAAPLRHTPQQVALPEPSPPALERAEKRLDDLSDLPPELLAELSDGVKSETDPIIKIINDRGGTATLDEILIDLYRKHGEVAKRTITNNKLNRLSRRSMVWSVPGKKGAYTTAPQVPDISETLNRKASENEKGSDAATSEPSSDKTGVAGLPGGPKKTSEVGPTPTASTVLHRNRLMSETAAVNLFTPKNRIR